MWCRKFFVVQFIVADVAFSADDRGQFDDFVLKHSRQYLPGSTEYSRRKSVFLQRAQDVEAHNSQPQKSWVAVVNKFADRTEDELRAARGYVHRPDRPVQAASLVAMEQEAQFVDLDLVRTKSWVNLSVASDVPNQGPCGSCWALATKSILDAHYEIHNRKPMAFSAQELVSCVKNPLECGGQGGCRGATVELGVQYVIDHGLSEQSDVEYAGKDLACEDLRRDRAHTAEDMNLLPEVVTLPKNKEGPLLNALINLGPVAVSVAAADWFTYSHGVYDGCNQGSWILDHAVTLYGIGVTDENQKYYLIRNSWGPDWGEAGFIRLERRGDEEQFCGEDTKPEQGVDCKNPKTHEYPKQLHVCGSCGILYDSVVPHFKRASGRVPVRIGDDRRSPGRITFVARNSSILGHRGGQPPRRASEGTRLMRGAGHKIGG